MKAKVGMTVMVFSPDQKEFLGIGDIIRVEDLIVEETGEILSHDYPIIKLLNGKELGGIECYWYSYDEKTFSSKLSEVRP